MPHFAGRKRALALGAAPGGYTFMECAELLKVVIEENCERPVVLVIHDWGCVWGFLLEMKYPNLVKCIIALDVGHPVSMKPKLQIVVATVAGLVYWYYMAVWNLVGRSGIPCARAIADFMVKMFIRFTRLTPMSRPNSAEVVKKITSDFGYPYAKIVVLSWKMFFGRAKHISDLFKPMNQSPSCPCLFMYGTDKPAPFHDPRWTKALRNREDCEVVGVDSGHWIPLEAPEEVNEQINLFLDKTIATPKL